MPRSKYTKAPGPLRPIERIVLEAFRFDDKARRELICLLPRQLQQLRVAENIKQTLAELIVGYTESDINSFLTSARELGDGPYNPANVIAAIRKLRAALHPFVAGWVDHETADIIPGDLDDRLAGRERELTGKRLPPLKRRQLGLLCQTIGVYLNTFAAANQVVFEERDKLRFVATALDHAGIEHSYSTENSSRFAALVFPRS